MFSVLSHFLFRQRQPVGGVTPNDSRNRSNKMIGLAGSPEISFDSLSIFPTSRAATAGSDFGSQSFFLRAMKPARSKTNRATRSGQRRFAMLFNQYAVPQTT